MNEIVNNYSRSQVANLSKKRSKLNKLVDSLKDERNGDNDKSKVDALSREISRRMTYLMKGSDKNISQLACH